MTDTCNRNIIFKSILFFKIPSRYMVKKYGIEVATQMMVEKAIKEQKILHLQTKQNHQS
jgi:hypothetical protein